jgi:Fic family protein
MSKQVILTCDRRHGQVVPAIGTFELSNGRTKGPRIDLCKGCYNEFLALFTVANKAELIRLKDRDRHRRKRLQPPTSHDQAWARKESLVMDAVKKLREKVQVQDVVKATGLSKYTVANTLRRLVAKEEVTTTGGQGRWRRYHLAT